MVAVSVQSAAISPTISVSDERWWTTLPHRATPQPDEWLPGLLLRCDEENGWPSGTVARMAFPTRHPSGGHRPVRASCLLGLMADEADADLRGLAALLRLDVTDIAVTALGPPLARLFPPASGRHGDAARALGATPALRVCPRCVAERRLIARAHAVPLLRSCVRHGVLLVGRCACGAPLTFFGGAPPFSCSACYRRWDELPVARADDTLLTRDRRLGALYALFLDRPSPGLRLAAAGLLMPEDGLGVPHDAVDERHLASLDICHAMARPLAHLIGDLADQAITPRQLEDAERVRASRVGRCLNRACPTDDTATGELRPLATPREIDASWCAACGAIHVDGHLFLSYDRDCAPGAAWPSSAAIDAASGRLADGRDRLDRLCRRDLGRGRPLDLERVFRDARLFAPQLRARRLGLVDLALHYAILQLALPATEVQRRLRTVWPRRTAHANCSRTDPSLRAASDLGNPARDSDVGDPEWARLAGVLQQGQAGDGIAPPAARAVLDAIRHIVRQGTAWRALPPDLPSAEVVHAALRAWSRTDTWRDCPELRAALDPLPCLPQL